MDTEFDLIIIGGGLIGMSLACALEHLPLKVAIVEQRPPSEHQHADLEVRALALSQSSRRIFNGLNIWSDINSAITPIENIHISAKGHFAATRLCASKWQEDAFAYIVEMGKLGQALYKRCRQLANVHWYCPAKLQMAVLNPNRAQIDLEYQDQILRLNTKLLVAADGTDSAVGKLLNIPRHVRDYDEQAIVANVELTRTHKFTAYERFTRQGAIALLPLNKQHCALVWAAPKQQALELISQSQPQFLSQLQTHFGYRLGRFVKIGKRHQFPLKLVRVDARHTKHLVFIGNAAQSLHPIAGQGFNLGLRDVAGLAQVIQEALVAGTPLGSQVMLAQYYKQRKWDQRKLILLTDGLVRMFSLPMSTATLLRSFLLLSIDTIKPLRSLLLTQVTGLGGRLPNLICGQPLIGQN